jgi:hypothetical protein
MLGVLNPFWTPHFWHQMYNVGGYLIASDRQLYNVPPLKTPFGLLLLLFQSKSHVTTFTRNYFLRCYTCTQLTITYMFVTTITCSTLTRLHSLQTVHSNLYCTIAHKVSKLTQYVFTGWLLSYRLLSQIITYFASSHFPCLSPIETSLVGLLLKTLVELLPKNRLLHSHSGNWTKQANNFAYIAELC